MEVQTNMRRRPQRDKMIRSSTDKAIPPTRTNPDKKEKEHAWREN